MIWNKQTIAGVSLAMLVTTAMPGTGSASVFKRKKTVDPDATRKLTAAQSALIDRAIVREREVIKVVRQRAPLVETYVQRMKPDPVMRQIPESDEHYLGRVEFGKIIGDTTYLTGPKAGEQPSKFSSIVHSPVGFLSSLGGSMKLQFHEAGFTQMMLMDSSGFDREHYNFTFVRSEFLGTVATSVFDVVPSGGKNDRGRFYGRIWVENQNGNVVRFNGDFAGSEKDYREYFHFDSWRTNIQPNLWLPTSFYVEESDSRSRTNTLSFKAINHVWGYALKVPQRDAENTSMEVVGATDTSNNAQDLSPLGAQRAFAKQAEDNVVERLYQAGLLDAPSEFDKTLEALANNILAYNNVVLGGPVRVRTLLTEPLESLSIGNTIVLSKSLIDTTAVITQDGAQQAGNLNALLAFQLAHIILGHKLDTKYAFNDRLLFPDNASFKRIPMHHTDAENEAAAKKAIELLQAKELVDSQRYFGLYLQSLQAKIEGLRALNEPVIGDGLTRGERDGTFWLAALKSKGEKLDVRNLKQQAAEPLSSFLRFDPWSDQVITLHTAFEPILSPSDKMAFEVTPVYIKLGYYQAPQPAAAASATQPGPVGPGNAGTAVPATSAPAGRVANAGGAAANTANGTVSPAAGPEATTPEATTPEATTGTATPDQAPATTPPPPQS
jgi:hypothetical protein